MGANAHRRGPRAPRILNQRASLPLEADLQGRFVRRYKRFFADIETPSGETLTVHCPNSGSMLGFHRPGAAVRCSTSENPKRKLRHTLEMMRIGRIWVGLNTMRANSLADRALRANSVPGLEGYAEVRREVRVEGGSRLDFRLDHRLEQPMDHRSDSRTGGRGSGAPDPRPAYVEVKSVTLADGATARFPDAVTERGRRHLDTLASLAGQGARSVLLYLVQRADCERVAPADDIDPAYGAALRGAAQAGVEVIALGTRWTGRSARVERQLPVLL